MCWVFIILHSVLKHFNRIPLFDIKLYFKLSNHDWNWLFIWFLTILKIEICGSFHFLKPNIKGYLVKNYVFVTPWPVCDQQFLQFIPRLDPRRWFLHGVFGWTKEDPLRIWNMPKSSPIIIRKQGPIGTNHSLEVNFKPIPASSSLFKPSSAYFCPFLPIPAYSSLFQHIPAYCSIF